MIPILFFSLAAIAIASAIMMIAHRNPIYSALFLILTLFSLAGFYVLLKAPFIAAVHIIVYAGAIMVLFLFVIMLLDLKKDTEREHPNRLLQIGSIIVCGILIGELVLFLKFSDQTSPIASQGPGALGGTDAIGSLLFTKYLFPFEIASILLLAAIIGSLILAKLKLR